MDLEELTRNHLRNGRAREDIINELAELTGSESKAGAILTEVENTLKLPEGFLNEICDTPKLGFSAGRSGLGCRGEGDFLIHRTIADIIGETGAVVDSRQQDDGGVIRTGQGYISAAVDGMHSRLSHYPFLAGFHAARAAVRDVIVMGAKPAAMLADIHIGNDGDIGKVLDYTAGASAVSELLNIPLIGGSTLRIGGDMVTGDRISGAIFSIGTADKLTARKQAAAGDVLVMTEGAGGGTITTTALYNGYPDVLLETLNVKTINVAMELLKTPLVQKVHAMTDITNGGIRGDAHEFGATADVKIILEREQIEGLISPGVLELLRTLDIDPLGISTDGLLFTVDPGDAEELIGFLTELDVRSSIVGRIEEGSGVYIKDAAAHAGAAADGDRPVDESSNGFVKLAAHFREAPYTPVKKVVENDGTDPDRLGAALEDAKRKIQMKKKQILDWIRTGHVE